MVTRSIIDYKQHKKDIFEVISKRYGIERAKKFIDFYSKRYDTFNRSFIDYRLGFLLMDDYNYVNRVGTRWYAFVGVGGSGKSTLAKNVFYFFDPTLDLKRISFNAIGFIKVLRNLDELNSSFMDEPDDSIHPSSRQGKALREILGKGRQHKQFLGICATDLKDIPLYIFRKLHGIFFCPFAGKYMFFKDKPKKRQFIMQKIRQDYGLSGYDVFFKYSKSSACLKGHTIADSPLDIKTNKNYLDIKKTDYKQSIDKFLDISLKSEKKGNDIDEAAVNRFIALKWNKEGKKGIEIARLLGISRQRVSQILSS